MKVVRVRHRRLIEYALLLTALLLSSSICFFAKPAKAQEEEAIIRITNPLSGDNHFTFNATEYPVNSTFTADFYVENVTGMAGWQIYIEWNNTVINFQKAWIPEDNALAPAVDQGASLFYPKPSVDVGFDSNETYTLTFGASVLPVTTTVDIPGQGLLCHVNFTIAAAPTSESRIFTNIALLGRNAGQMASFIVFPTPWGGVRLGTVFAQPAIVSIETIPFQYIRVVEIASLVANPQAVQLGQNTRIHILIKNSGNDIATFNVTIKREQTTIAFFPQVLGAYDNFTYEFVWDSSNVTLDVPISVAILGVPVVISHNATIRFSVELALPKGFNENNTYEEVTVNVGQNPSGLSDYLVWVALEFFSTAFGELIICYAIACVGFFVALSVYRRLKSHRFPQPTKLRTAEKPKTS